MWMTIAVILNCAEGYQLYKDSNIPSVLTCESFFCTVITFWLVSITLRVVTFENYNLFLLVTKNTWSFKTSRLVQYRQIVSTKSKTAFFFIFDNLLTHIYPKMLQPTFITKLWKSLVEHRKLFPNKTGKILNK